MAEPHRLISIAIAKLELERAETGAKRPDLTDELVALLLNRADWRLDAGDLIGARQDARRILDGLNPNVSMAYRLLAKTDVDDLVRKEHYEKALEVDPANATALWELATLLPDTDPQRALELQERRLKFVNLKSEGYEAIAKLQLKLGRPEVALPSVAAAISITPFRTRLFELRRDIEVALNRDKNRISAQLAAGYRRAGDYSATNGDQAEALSTYLRGLDILGGITTDDEAARFELEATIRNLSEFISSHYSKQDTRQFWESLAKAGITKNYRAQVQQEIRRLAIEN
jgi:tetratricopeptide (TPR) repeat protein